MKAHTQRLLAESAIGSLCFWFYIAENINVDRDVALSYLIYYFLFLFFLFRMQCDVNVQFMNHACTSKTAGPKPKLNDACALTKIILQLPAIL